MEHRASHMDPYTSATIDGTVALLQSVYAPRLRDLGTALQKPFLLRFSEYRRTINSSQVLAQLESESG